MVNCAIEVYKEGGLRAFWRGFGACASRCMFANQFLFLTYESTRSSKANSLRLDFRQELISKQALTGRDIMSIPRDIFKQITDDLYIH